MNEQEIIDEINKTKEYLSNLEKILKECECVRWKPRGGDRYYYISEGCTVIESRTCAGCIVDEHYRGYNIFKTEEEAKQEAEKILVRRQLEDIARRLNKGQKINWNNNNQLKYCIGFDFPLDIISIGAIYRKLQGSVYCLSDEFKDVAIQEIGKERLKKYFKGEYNEKIR